MTRLRILYADTDWAGVVYHGNYLRYFEQARTEWFYEAGFDVAELHESEGIVFAISECSLQYLRSARYGDQLEIEVFPTRLGRARVTLGYEVTVTGQPGLVVTGQTTFAALNAATGRVVRLPAGLRAMLAEALSQRAG